MLRSISEFIDYFAGIRRRTLTYAHTIPPDQLNWLPQAGEFTCGDILRHLIAAEHMYVELICQGRWKYPGHVRQTPESLDEIVARMETGHIAAMAALSQLSDGVLFQQRPSFLPDAPQVKVWRWLMAMVEHEIHHRSQLAGYLTLMGYEPPQIYGVTVEDLIARSTE